MNPDYGPLLQQAYDAFNRRDIPKVLALMDKNVKWSNGWEGGYVDGHTAVKNYWTRQWEELNPTVIPVNMTERNDGRIEVTVHQVVKNMKDEILFDGIVRHVYTFRDGLIAQMDIEKE